MRGFLFLLACVVVSSFFLPVADASAGIRCPGGTCSAAQAPAPAFPVLAKAAQADRPVISVLVAPVRVVHRAVDRVRDRQPVRRVARGVVRFVLPCR